LFLSPHEFLCRYAIFAVHDRGKGLSKVPRFGLEGAIAGENTEHVSEVIRDRKLVYVANVAHPFVRPGAVDLFGQR
jgi:hypothetical protein